MTIENTQEFACSDTVQASPDAVKASDHWYFNLPKPNHDLNQSALILGRLAAQGWTEPEKPLEYGWLWKMIKTDPQARQETVSHAHTNQQTLFRRLIDLLPLRRRGRT